MPRIDELAIELLRFYGPPELVAEIARLEASATRGAEGDGPLATWWTRTTVRQRALRARAAILVPIRDSLPYESKHDRAAEVRRMIDDLPLSDVLERSAPAPGWPPLRVQLWRAGRLSRQGLLTWPPSIDVIQRLRADGLDSEIANIDLETESG